MTSPLPLYAFHPYDKSACAVAGSSNKFFSLTASDKTPLREDFSVPVLVPLVELISIISSVALIGRAKYARNVSNRASSPMEAKACLIRSICRKSPSVPATCGSCVNRSCQRRNSLAFGMAINFSAYSLAFNCTANFVSAVFGAGICVGG